MLNPSNGFVVLMVPPARPTSVGSQSEMWISSLQVVPVCFRSGLATNPIPLTPPSHSVAFLPRRGQLLPPQRVWPPLSTTKKKHTQKEKQNNEKHNEANIIIMFSWKLDFNVNTEAKKTRTAVVPDLLGDSGDPRYIILHWRDQLRYFRCWI